MEDLDAIIIGMPLEIKRALVIKMIKEKYLMRDICSTLSVTKSFVEKWRAIYNKEGAKDLKPKYKGSSHFLTEEALKDINEFLTKKESCCLNELTAYIKNKHGITYKSKQSYYDIFTGAGMSWKKTEQINPKKDEKLVRKKREEIKKNLKIKKRKSVQEIWSY